MGIRAATRKSIGAVFVVATAAVAVPLLAAAPANAEPVTIHSEGSVAVESFPSTKVIHLDKFDDGGGLLELSKVTVIASVSGALEGSVKNLSESREKALAGSFKASIVVNGIGVSDLAATGQNAASWALAPEESRPLGLVGNDSSGTTITDPTVLAQFVGEGALDYTVHSDVAVDINGPAPYKTTGVAGGEATVRVEYTYNDVCSDNPNDPKCVTPPECETSTVSVAPVGNGDYAITGGGTFTISNYANGPSGWTFDWSVVDATVESITVQGGHPVGSVITQVDGASSGTGLHGPDDGAGTHLEPTAIQVCATSTPPCDPNDPNTPDDPYCEPPCEPTITTTSKHSPYDECEPPCEEPTLTSTLTSSAPGQDECEPPCPTTLTGDGTCEPPTCATTLTVDDGCEPEPTCESDPEMDGCTPPPTCTTSFSKHDCEPGPTCDSDPSMAGCQPASNQCRTVEGFKVDPVTAGEYGGMITITNVRQGTADGHAGQLFDWTSTDPILAITVKGGPVANTPEHYTYGPAGATSGTALHAPLNPNNDKWYGLSHLCVKAAPVPEPPRSKTSPPASATSTAPPAPTEADGAPGAGEPEQTDPGDQPPAKPEKSPAPEQVPSDEPEPDPKPEPKPDPKPEPEVKPEPKPAPPPPPAPKPQPAPDKTAGDAPAAQ